MPDSSIVLFDATCPTVNKPLKLIDNGDGTYSLAMVTEAVITGDVEIGAVELKNAADDTRAVVKTDGTNNALVVVQNASPQGVALASARVISPTAGSKTVTSSGTALSLVSSTTRAFSVLIQALSTNTDSVFLGSSAVHHTTSKQIVLPPGSPPVTLSAPPGYALDLAVWFIDANVNAEGVGFVYEA